MWCRVSLGSATVVLCGPVVFVVVVVVAAAVAVVAVVLQINSHNHVRGHRTGISHSTELRNTPRGKTQADQFEIRCHSWQWPTSTVVNHCGSFTWGVAIHKSLLNLRATLKDLARTCNFAGAEKRGFVLSHRILVGAPHRICAGASYSLLE